MVPSRTLIVVLKILLRSSSRPVTASIIYLRIDCYTTFCNIEYAVTYGVWELQSHTFPLLLFRLILLFFLRILDQGFSQVWEVMMQWGALTRAYACFRGFSI